MRKLTKISILLLTVIQNEIGGELKISARDVPHLVLNNNFSICYFGKHDKFRTWTNYGKLNNSRYKDFKNFREVIDHFKEKEFIS